MIPAIQKAMDHPGPFLIDFVVEPEENVYPMVVPGAAITEIIEAPGEKVEFRQQAAQYQQSVSSTKMSAIKHTIVALVEDRPGVLNRVASLFRRRGFNIESLAVGHSEIPGLSRMTIVVNGATTAVEQVRKQLDKLIEVIKVTDISEETIVARELALIKVESSPSTRSEIMQITDIFRASILDVAPDSIVIEVTGDDDKVSSLVELLRGFGIIELARTGRIAMVRGTIGPLRKQGQGQSKRRSGR